MAEISKEDCLTMDQAIKEIGCSKGTFYTYLNYLRIQRYKFSFDRKAYILKVDVERVKEFIKGNR